LLISISGLLAALGLGIALLIPQFGAFYVGGGIIGVAIGLFYAASWALGTEIVPSEQAGQYLGLSNLAGAGAGAIGAYIGGPIADSQGYMLLFAVYGMLFMLSVFAATRVRMAASSAPTPPGTQHQRWTVSRGGDDVPV
jgi:MFS family permease